MLSDNKCAVMVAAHGWDCPPWRDRTVAPKPTIKSRERARTVGYLCVDPGEKPESLLDTAEKVFEVGRLD